MKKHRDLQPWLDYFQMLRTYEEKGFLQMEPEKHEAYVTHPALFAITPGDNLSEQITYIPKTVRSLRTYAGWKSQHGGDYLNKTFAVHVVKEDTFAPLYTIVLSRRRLWWKPWRKSDHIEMVEYK